MAINRINICSSCVIILYIAQNCCQIHLVRTLQSIYPAIIGQQSFRVIISPNEKRIRIIYKIVDVSLFKCFSINENTVCGSLDAYILIIHQSLYHIIHRPTRHDCRIRWPQFLIIIFCSSCRQLYLTHRLVTYFFVRRENNKTKLF